MVKYYEDSTIFNFNWDQVAQGFWRRYPNPYSSHVLTEDTVVREVRPDGKLHSKRILKKTNRTPDWGKKIFKGTSVYIIEESVVDPKEQTIITYTRNIGFNTIMSVVEKVIYTPSKETPGKTVAVRSAWIDSHLYGFAGALRAFGFDRFKKNCNKAALGFNHILQNMFPSPFLSHKDATHAHSAAKLKEATKTVSDHVKAQAEQLYQAYSVKN